MKPLEFQFGDFFRASSIKSAFMEVENTKARHNQIELFFQKDAICSQVALESGSLNESTLYSFIKRINVLCFTYWSFACFYLGYSILRAPLWTFFAFHPLEDLSEFPLTLANLAPWRTFCLRFSLSEDQYSNKAQEIDSKDLFYHPTS